MSLVMSCVAIWRILLRFLKGVINVYGMTTPTKKKIKFICTSDYYSCLSVFFYDVIYYEIVCEISSVKFNTFLFSAGQFQSDGFGGQSDVISKCWREYDVNLAVPEVTPTGRHRPYEGTARIQPMSACCFNPTKYVTIGQDKQKCRKNCCKHVWTSLNSSSDSQLPTADWCVTNSVRHLFKAGLMIGCMIVTVRQRKSSCSSCKRINSSVSL